MKCPWLKYFAIITGIVLFTGCKDHKSTATSDTDPVFTSTPRLKSLTDQINSTPADAALYFERGAVLHKMKLDTLAIKDYKTAATLDTNKAGYMSAVGDILFENKDINGAIEWIQKAINKDPKDRKAHLKIAKLFLYLKNYSKAFGEINLVLRQNVYDPEGYFLKGMIYKDMKDTARAISNFETAVQVAPDYHDAIIQLGLMMSAKNDPIALKYLDNAYREDTTDVFPIFAKGVYYQNNKDYPKAKDEYKKCILRNNRYVDAYFNMGYILMQQDSTEKAYRQYDIVTRLDPINPTAYYDRGLCSEIMNKTKEAIADYQQAGKLDTAYKSPKEALKRLGVQ